jgi:undecaprenyl-diphosphatase
MNKTIACMALVLAGLSKRACAGGLDQVVTFDESGIWGRGNQQALSYGTGAAVMAGSLFLPSDTRLGRTFDRSMDAMVMTMATTTVLKYGFSRARPNQGGDPGDFFAGGGHDSFPSGEVAQVSAVVTPFIAEYGADHPLVWGLALLPAYDAVARVKSQEHWQSDVLAGAAIGVAFGVYAHRRETPFFFQVLPDGGGMFAYRKSF